MRDIELCGLLDAVGETGFLVHGLGDGNVDFLSIVKVCADFVAEFAFGEFDVVLGGPFAGHQVEESVINVDLVISLQCDVKVPIGIHYGERGGHPCCGWKGRDLPISFG